jgi:hypothetical protein
MGVLSWMMGNAKSAEKIVSAGISGVDKLVFTEEEKADYNHKLQELHLEFVKVAASESTAQSISRRMICLPVVYVWLLLIVLNTGLAIGGFEGSTTAIMKAIEHMNMPALAAIGFYVGRHIASKGK